MNAFSDRTSDTSEICHCTFESFSSDQPESQSWTFCWTDLFAGKYPSIETPIYVLNKFWSDCKLTGVLFYWFLQSENHKDMVLIFRNWSHSRGKLCSIQDFFAHKTKLTILHHIGRKGSNLLQQQMDRFNRSNNHLNISLTTGRIQLKVLTSCLAKRSDSGSTLLKYYVNVQVFNF